LNELQISDYKWSGIVRKIDIGSGGVFVDIPTIQETRISASLLYDPLSTSESVRTSLMTVYSPSVRIKSAHVCHDRAKKFEKFDQYGNMYVYNITGVVKSDLKCIQVSDGSKDFDVDGPTESRLRFGSTIWFLFTYWFESLQIIVLVLYVGTVWFARKIFLKTALKGSLQNSESISHLLADRIIPLNLVLSPLIPNSLSEHLYKREWLVANGVALFDLQTRDVIMDTETTRIGFMIFLYFLTALSLNFRLSLRSNRITLGSWVWLAFLAFPQFMDVRFIIGRGGFRSLVLSPHTWYMIWYWYKWLYPLRATRAATSPKAETSSRSTRRVK
jgi:hypothetical protein